MTDQSLKQTEAKVKKEIATQLSEQIDNLINRATVIEPLVMRIKKPHMICTNEKCKHELVQHALISVGNREAMTRCQICDQTCTLIEEALLSGYLEVANKMMEEVFYPEGDSDV